MSVKDCQFIICRFSKHFLYDFVYQVCVLLLLVFFFWGGGKLADKH